MNGDDNRRVTVLVISSGNTVTSTSERFREESSDRLTLVEARQGGEEKAGKTTILEDFCEGERTFAIFANVLNCRKRTTTNFNGYLV